MDIVEPAVKRGLRDMCDSLADAVKAGAWIGPEAPSSDLWRVDEVAALTKDVVLVRFACTRDSVTPGTVWVTREATYFAPSLVGKVSSFFSFSSKKEEKLIRMAHADFIKGVPRGLARAAQVERCQSEGPGRDVAYFNTDHARGLGQCLCRRGHDVRVTSTAASTLKASGRRGGAEAGARGRGRGRGAAAARGAGLPWRRQCRLVPSRWCARRLPRRRPRTDDDDDVFGCARGRVYHAYLGLRVVVCWSLIGIRLRGVPWTCGKSETRNAETRQGLFHVASPQRVVCGGETARESRMLASMVGSDRPAAI